MKLQENPVTKQKWVTIPKVICEALGWKKEQTLKIEIAGKGKILVSEG